MSHPYIFDFPISLYFNFKVLPFRQAYKLPFRISYQTKIASAYKDVIKITGNVHHNMIHIGAPGVDGVVGFRKNYIRMGKPSSCSITFRGAAKFAQGALINVDRGKLVIGNNFGVNNNSYISCNKEIILEDDIGTGWNVSFMDSDNHTIMDEHGNKNYSKGIHIGNHVWIGSNASILKSTNIPNNCVVAYNSCVTKKFSESNCLIGGSPAKVLKTNITWSDDAIY